MNFVMNLYLYALLAKTLKRTATRFRLIGGSAAGAAFFVFWVLLPGVPAIIKRYVGPMGISLIAAAFILRLDSIRMVWKAAGYLSVYAFAFGGMMKFLFSAVPFLKGKQEKAWYILGAGMLGYQAAAWWIVRIRKKRQEDIYKVRLRGSRNEIELDALMDTGNSLREPVSGRPVSVVEEEYFLRLLEIKAPERLKVIPYHSIGKSNGIMEGYEVPEIIIKGKEENLRWQKAIIAVSRNKVSADGKYQMILHPDLCNETLLRKNTRHRRPEMTTAQEGK
ncbi:MAG TPA: hypothetical protein DCZ40_07325 [Lachnospiraceae bacterium]|nr:hypothetical protein [Lachnospiraceae bacterium]